MTARRRVLQGAGLAIGLGAAAYGAGRWAARRGRRAHDPHHGRSFDPPFDASHVITTSDGAALHVVARGAGIPVVLAHGVTNDHRSWFHQIDDLPAHGIRVVAFDQRGHGRSTVGEGGFGVRPLADDLRALLEGLDLHDAVIVGHSMGGMAVQALACHHPEVVAERVAGIVLIGTTAHALRFWRSLERIPSRVTARGEAWLDRLMVHDDLGYVTTRLGLGSHPYASHVELVRRMLLECPPETRTLATRALMEYDVRALLCDVNTPVLVMCGSRDFLAPLAASRRIVDALPHATLRVIAGAGHMPQLERSDEVTKAIAEFAHEVTGSSERATAAG